jgi:hypothetical protein
MFKNDNIQPTQAVAQLPILNLNVRSTNEQTSRRDRQCFKCTTKILKGSKYIASSIRYDKTILTLSYHKECF